MKKESDLVLCYYYYYSSIICMLSVWLFFLRLETETLFVIGPEPPLNISIIINTLIHFVLFDPLGGMNRITVCLRKLNRALTQFIATINFLLTASISLYGITPKQLAQSARHCYSCHCEVSTARQFVDTVRFLLFLLLTVLDQEATVWEESAAANFLSSSESFIWECAVI